jgi:hypothetical protein
VDWRSRTNGITWFKDTEMTQPEDVLKLGFEKLDVLFAHDAPLFGEPAGLGPLEDREDNLNAEENRLRILEAIENTRPGFIA